MTIRNNDGIECTESSGNIFEDLGVSEPEKHKAKVALAIQINQIIERRGLKQIEAANILEIDQAKVSALHCGRLKGFSIERLIDFLNKLDRDVEIVIKKRPTRRKSHGHLKVAFG